LFFAEILRRSASRLIGLPLIGHTASIGKDMAGGGAGTTDYGTSA